MTANGTSAVARDAAPGRVDWVDYAKGICIVMVVMMHSVLGVETWTPGTWPGMKRSERA